MAFDWENIHKWEENIENLIIRETFEYVQEYYSVNNIEDLTAEQVAEIEEFAESDYTQHSLMYRGLREVVEQHNSMTHFGDD